MVAAPGLGRGITRHKAREDACGSFVSSTLHNHHWSRTAFMTAFTLAHTSTLREVFAAFYVEAIASVMRLGVFRPIYAEIRYFHWGTTDIE